MTAAPSGPWSGRGTGTKKSEAALRRFARTEEGIVFLYLADLQFIEFQGVGICGPSRKDNVLFDFR